MIITIWERLNEKTAVWHHNHIADGFDAAQTAPTPASALQRRSWAKGRWRKREARLVDGEVVSI